MLVFLVTAILFLIFAIIGKTTKVDLTKISTILLMALLGIIICTIINIFLQNSTFDMILSGISVLIFLGFIAYDIQKRALFIVYHTDVFFQRTSDHRSKRGFSGGDVL